MVTRYKSLLKRALIISTLCLSLITLSGCGEGLDVVATAFNNASSARIEANKKLVDDLANAGVIDSKLQKSLKTHLDEVYENTLKVDMKSDASLTEKVNVLKTKKALFSSVYEMMGITDSKGNVAGRHGLSPENLKNSTLHGMILQGNNSATKEIINSIPKYPNGTNNSLVPIDLFGEQANLINASVKGKVYILDLEAVISKIKASGAVGKNDTVTLDQLAAYMNKINETAVNLSSGTHKNPDGSEMSRDEFTSILNDIFKPATDSGAEVSLIDTSKPEFQLVQKDKIAGQTLIPHGLIKHPTDLTNYPNVPGNPLSIVQQLTTDNGSTVEMTTVNIALVELNAEAVANVIEAHKKQDEDYMRFASSNGGENYYLMKYPIKSVSNLVNNDNNTFQLEFDESGLDINFKTGKLVKNSDGQLDSITEDEPYMHISSKTDPNFSSIALVNGVNSKTQRDVFDSNGSAKKVSIEIPAFVFRDYLEFTYSPDVVDGEHLVAYGRKLRLRLNPDINYKYTITDIFADYVGIDGKQIPTDVAPSVYAQQISDIEAALGDPEINKRLPGRGEVAGDIPGVGDKATMMQDLPTKIVGAGEKIRVSINFPSSSIGSIDYPSTGSKPIMPGILINTDINRSGLMNHWIVTDDTKDSLIWWNGWLERHGFNYRLKGSSVKDWVNTKYDIILGPGSDTVIFDMDTIGKINDDLWVKEDIKVSRFVSTLAKLVGAIFTMYSPLLVAAWAYDSHIGIGIELLPKLTFGRWVAVRYADEAVEAPNGVRLMTLSKLIPGMLVIVALGLSLVLIPFPYLISYIIKVFGSLFEVIMGMIRGASIAINS